jgi:hypothetical protein
VRRALLDLALVGAIKHADLEAGAISSAVEHSLHTGGVAGSIPASPTIQSWQTAVVSGFEEIDALSVAWRD